MQNPTDPILVADVGGTKTVLALALDAENIVQLTDVQTFPSNRFSRFDDLLNAYVLALGILPKIAVLAVAGPVLDGQAKLTNLPWQLDEQAIKTGFGFRDARLINDLEAMAWSLPYLVDADVVILQEGVRASEGTMALIAPGTGLGEAFLTWDGTSYIAHATEGGHADFAPCDEGQDQLLASLRDEYGHVSIERVCSGDGLANIYRFLIQQRGKRETPNIQAQIEEAGDITPVVIAAAMSNTSSVCEHAVRIFIDSLAAEAGNLALKTLATGGVFFGGGIPMRMLPLLQSPLFIDRFTSKGRFSEFLQRVPVAVLRDPLSPLRGAAIYASRVVTDWHNTGRRA